MKKIYFCEKHYRKVPISFQLYNGNPQISSIGVDTIAQLIMKQIEADHIAFTGIFKFESGGEKVLKYPMAIPQEKWWPVFECDDFYYIANCEKRYFYILRKSRCCDDGHFFWEEIEAEMPILLKVGN